MDYVNLECNSKFKDIHDYVINFAIIFILIGIGSGLYPFILPNRNKNRIGQGIVTGLGVGFGGMTVSSVKSMWLRCFCFLD